MDTLLRRRMMIAVGGGSPTPPVETIPYIRGGADGSYIDTGITPDSTMRVIVWARNFNPGVTPNTALFGSREEDVATNTIQMMTSVTNNTGKIFARFGNGTAYWTESDFSMFGHYHKYELRPNGIYIDDSLKASVSVPSTMSNNFSLFLFACNNAGTRSNNIACPIDICACKIYKNDTLVRDFTAVNSPSVGLYDAVSDTVFTNAGGGSFSYGEFNPNVYTPLEYVSGSGAQYFDSGIKGTYSLQIVCKCMPTTSSAVFHELLGYRASSSCCCVGFGNTTYANARIYWRFGANETVTYPYEGGSGGAVSLTNQSIVILKSNATLSVYKNNTSIGSAEKTGVSSSFQTNDTLYVGRTHNHTNGPFRGRLYYVGFGSLRNYVPAKVNDVAGLYDTYNDVFKPSMTSTPFTAGTPINQ